MYQIINFVGYDIFTNIKKCKAGACASSLCPLRRMACFFSVLSEVFNQILTKAELATNYIMRYTIDNLICNNIGGFFIPTKNDVQDLDLALVFCSVTFLLVTFCYL